MNPERAAQLEEQDLIHWGVLSHEARKGIADLYARHDWEDLDGGDKNWLLTEEAAMMFFRLRATDDTPETFPKGKWATIQTLESLIDGAMLGKVIA